MNERELWNEVYDLIGESQKEISVFDGNESVGYAELEKMNLLSLSTLGVIIIYSSGICVDNWIRILGRKLRYTRGFCFIITIKKKMLLWKK